MTMIAVTGASGKLGGATVRYLLERKVVPNSIAAVVRDPAKVTGLSSQGVQVRRGDYTDPRSLEDAFGGVETLLFISTNVVGEERMLHHRNIVNAARAAKVQHVIYTSVIKPAPDAKFAASPGHFHTEALIRESGMRYTFFRNNLYADLVPVMFGEAVQTGTLAHNGGDGRIGFVAREDIARALAAVLAEGEHTNREYPITAVTPYSLNDVAGALGKVSGKRIVYTPISSDEFRKALEAKGLPPPIVAMSVGLGEAIRAGEFDAGSTQLERLMERAPLTLEAFLSRQAAEPTAARPSPGRFDR
jgi:NAD(P)H dehydrogenase (quinone)